MAAIPKSPSSESARAARRVRSLMTRIPSRCGWAGAAADLRTRPGGVRTRHGRTVDTPLLGVTMRILESGGGLATHVGWAQPEMGGRRRDPEGFVLHPSCWG